MKWVPLMRFLIILCALLAFSSAARANCLGGGALSPGEVAKFNGAPAAYFSGMNNSAMQDAVRKLAASDESTIAGIMTAFKSMPLAMQTVMTQGLGLAAKACQANEPHGRAIQLAAADLSPSLRAVFDSFAGQRDVGSTGGGGAGAAGGASGGGITSTSGTSTNFGYTGPTSSFRSSGATTTSVGGTSGPSVATGGATTTGGTFITTLTTQTFITNAVPQPTSP